MCKHDRNRTLLHSSAKRAPQHTKHLPKRGMPHSKMDRHASSRGGSIRKNDLFRKCKVTLSCMVVRQTPGYSVIYRQKSQHSKQHSTAESRLLESQITRTHDISPFSLCGIPSFSTSAATGSVLQCTTNLADSMHSIAAGDSSSKNI